MIILLLTVTQGSYKFLDPKSKTFSRLFPKQFIISFSQTPGYQIGDQSRPQKIQVQSLFYDALQINGWDWIRFDQNEYLKDTSKAHLVVAFKKNQDFLPFFQTLSSFFRLFPGLENCWANFKTCSRIQDSVRTLLTIIKISCSSNFRQNLMVQPYSTVISLTGNSSPW